MWALIIRVIWRWGGGGELCWRLQVWVSFSLYSIIDIDASRRRGVPPAPLTLLSAWLSHAALFIVFTLCRVVFMLWVSYFSLSLSHTTCCITPCRSLLSYGVQITTFSRRLLSQLCFQADVSDALQDSLSPAGAGQCHARSFPRPDCDSLQTFVQQQLVSLRVSLSLIVPPPAAASLRYPNALHLVTVGNSCLSLVLLSILCVWRVQL